MNLPLRRLGLTVWTLIGLASGGAAWAATFTPLGDLPGGDFDSLTTDISDDGQIVVGFSKSDLGTEAVRWTRDTGLVALSSLTGETVPTIARAVSNSGAIAGQLDYTEEQCSVDAVVLPSAAVWTEEFGFVPLGGSASFAHDLSADGTAVTGTTCEFFVDSMTGEQFEVERPYRWTETGGLFVLGHRGESFGISADGSVIAGYGPVGNGDGTFSNQAFLWTPDFGDIAEPLASISGSEPPDVSEAYDISANGEVIVGAYRTAAEGAIVEGFRWTQQTGFEGLGRLAEFPSFVFDVSDDGTTIVGEQWLDDAGDSIFATIWDPVNGLRDLKALLSQDASLAAALENWTLIRGNGISADGRAIVGFGTNPDGKQEGWIVRLDENPPPPPSLEGDYNNNGTVEQGDLDLVLLNWGADATTAPLGWTNNLPGGTIDQNELDGVLLNWGDTAPAGLGASAAVPEPTTLAGTIVMLVFMAAGRRLVQSRSATPRE